jgi:hypothetical protein
LTATPGSLPNIFSGWGGDCSGLGTQCDLTLSGDRTVTATFNTAS